MFSKDDPKKSLALSIFASEPSYFDVADTSAGNVFVEKFLETRFGTGLSFFSSLRKMIRNPLLWDVANASCLNKKLIVYMNNEGKRVIDDFYKHYEWNK